MSVREHYAKIQRDPDVRAALKPALDVAEMIDGDVYAPRNERERYRVYELRGPSRELTLLFTTPTLEGVGVGLVEQIRDRLPECPDGSGKPQPYGPIGVLDGVAGHWLVSPWAHGRGIGG